MAATYLFQSSPIRRIGEHSNAGLLVDGSLRGGRRNTTRGFGTRGGGGESTALIRFLAEPTQAAGRVAFPSLGAL